MRSLLLHFLLLHFSLHFHFLLFDLLDNLGDLLLPHLLLIFPRRGLDDTHYQSTDLQRQSKEITVQPLLGHASCGSERAILRSCQQPICSCEERPM